MNKCRQFPFFVSYGLVEDTQQRNRFYWFHQVLFYEGMWFRGVTLAVQSNRGNMLA